MIDAPDTWPPRDDLPTTTAEDCDHPPCAPDSTTVK